MTTTAQHCAEVLPLNPSDLLTPDQVAAALGLSHRTLAAWRSSRRHPLPYVKIGSRVRYRRQDVDAWLQSQLHTNSAEA
ncbi:TPA: helix-turn-helix domain-containing protein [Pseudomonas aeruginosa]|uniref:helix-turn-helix domain-containing protein n=1 Tax=Pseudomonas aeruginosa TaxID=287 RepID=UPI0008482188|nr:helix-turn-helix domain-containing protein [Pseudomonas aeruginosa]AON69837.1 excisionase [Pseudomonas aeruginosa]MBH9101541.1 helix-turn-helix domain-containing protein [Pseudomonas aeruginosa]MCS7871086.1 helix-turn-helix domain-containing protein [Pseudomonas aeruginosa]MDU0742235.1 helix-turn-helix domain-containing protein [Pseudomonas aeruginosa]MDU0754804.1 helix-turn-helix domain-containing protein [Pseudomonas aeruginosa]